MWMEEIRARDLYFIGLGKLENEARRGSNLDYTEVKDR